MLYILLFYDCSFLHVRNLAENVLFSTLILGSVLSDYVIFYGIVLLLTRFSFLVFPYFFVSVLCTRLGWPSRQLILSTRYNLSYRFVSYHAKFLADRSNRC